ncbi:ankyrin repeat domain-containing protein [Legionella maioricensis]|uniref:Ankyrin repeat domain-containing protein n=1 Tax=Legionella maioricensis TaxID=2896528 RepID=A0A9X2D270_9GAMM|nr:ankyrin repeat domain-containing protein [Legionella maioricensis]MCL9684402.1 ankyrin repeat domain-containing protein [Legionella maioricensis]MCL9687583.1 ankyrin repeat domain-containing protein [Legionella maioricensis]
MSNSLHKLIEEYKEFMKEEFILFSRTSLSGANYYMLVPKNREKSKIQTANGELTTVGLHITVYEKVRKEVQNSTFHITINLIDENKNGDVARIYYSELGQYLFTTVKNKENTSIDTVPESLLKFGIKNIAPFVAKISKLKQDYLAQYKLLEDRLKQLSIELDHGDSSALQKKLLAYKQELERMISHIRSGTLFNQEHVFELKHYNDLLMDTEIKLSQLELAAKTNPPQTVQEVAKKSQVVITSFKVEKQAKTTRSEPSPKALQSIVPINKPAIKKEEEGPTPERVKIDELNKKIAAILHSGSLSSVGKVLQEYELQKHKFSLLEKKPAKKDKKSDKKIDETEFLDTLIRSNQLSEEINKTVLKILHEEAIYTKIEKQSLKYLLQNCTLNTEDIVELAVKNNRVQVLELVMQLRKDVNLERKTKEEKQYLLEIAYNKGYFNMFKCLLAHKASPDIVCTNKQPILFAACADARPEEMEALLEAKANPWALDPRGFAALGALVMRTSKQFNKISMAKVFLTYVPQAVEQLQGKEESKSTPLAYACQEDMWDVVELLLQFGANPNNPRHDGITPFGVCVYKNNFKLFKYVVENSTVPIREGLESALDLAVICERQHFIEYIMQYSKEHQLNLSVPSIADAQKRYEKLSYSPPSLISFGTNLKSIFFQTFCEDNDEDDMPLIVKFSSK